MMIHNQQSHQRAVESGEIQGDTVYEGDAFDVELLHFPDGDHVFHLRAHDRMLSLWLDSALLRELDYSVELALGGLEQSGDERVAVHFMPGDPPLWDIELTLLEGPLPYLTLALEREELDELHVACQVVRPVMLDLPVADDDED